MLLGLWGLLQAPGQAETEQDPDMSELRSSSPWARADSQQIVTILKEIITRDIGLQEGSFTLCAFLHILGVPCRISSGEE